MNNTQRGMKKWQPFNALEHFNEYISESYKEKNLLKRPQLSQEQIDELNNSLTIYNHDEVNITHYKQGEILQTKGIINKIDVPNQVLTINKTKILFMNLLKIDFCN